MGTNREIQASSSLPYPPISAKAKNLPCARAMLDNMAGVGSEISNITLYFYNRLITSDNSEISLMFHKISIVEMHHLEIFGQLAMQLGENPRLWTQKGSKKLYWNPSYNTYAADINSILQTAIKGENGAIDKYTRQCQQIHDSNVIANLERIIVDERLHVEIFQHLHQEYCK